MAILVPLILVALAVLMAIVSMLASRRKAKQQASTGQARILIHAINDDRCTGCDACVAVCPTNVLDLISNKSRVLRFQDCIQCEACMWACPTEALVMFPEGTVPPAVRVPDIDPFYQTAISGQYLIGEVAGKPLVKNAANLGRAVVEHMLQTGLVATPGHIDVLIVGSGPGGLSAALSCKQRGLSYVLLEKENIISSTVSRYPKGKLVMAEPYDAPNYSLLPVFDSGKEELIALWKELIQLCEIDIRMHETVQSVNKQPDGNFVTTTTGGNYRSQRVILATGTRGKPRTLGIQGENLPKVFSQLDDPADHRGKAVCVVGGGDSALEAALALADAGARVIMSYRGRSFHRAQARNRERIEQGAAQGRIKIKMQSEIVDFGEETVTLQMADGMQKRYPNEAAFVLIGSDPPIKWLGTLGIHYVERPHMQPAPASDALVKQLLPAAEECPEQAHDAAEQVFGRPVAHRPKSVSQPPVSQPPPMPQKAGVGRRFVRSASSLFGIGDENKRASSISEFAQEIPRERPRQRDSLAEGERTRILRMLRDEGGRHADEESKLIHLDEMVAPSPSPSEPPRPSIPKAGASKLPPPFPSTVDTKPEERPATFEPVIDDEATAHFSPEEVQGLLDVSGSLNPFEVATSEDYDPDTVMIGIGEDIGMDFSDEATVLDDSNLLERLAKRAELEKK